MPQAAQLKPLQLLEAAPMPPRADHPVIATMVREGAKVLDVGCGDGQLLARLAAQRGVRGRGLDINQANVNACVVKGLSAVQADADRDLADFPKASFDYVIFANTLQALRRPRIALQHAARIGERVIVSIANYGHWAARWRLLTSGRIAAPASAAARWCETDNIHPCSIRDLAGLADELNLTIERALPMSKGTPGAPFAASRARANWFAEEAVFLLTP